MTSGDGANIVIRAKKTGVGSSIAYVDGEGVETDISKVVERVDVSVSANGLTKATLHGIFVDTEAHAYIEDVFIRALPRDLIPAIIVRLQEMYVTPPEERDGDNALYAPMNHLGDKWHKYYATQSALKESETIELKEDAA